jgi:hypothetical protein
MHSFKDAVISVLLVSAINSVEPYSSSDAYPRPTPGALLQPFVDGLGSFQDAQADFVGINQILYAS